MWLWCVVVCCGVLWCVVWCLVDRTWLQSAIVSSLTSTATTPHSLTHGFTPEQRRLITHKFDSRSQSSCLQLLTTTFSQLIDQLSNGKPQLSALLSRVRDSYRSLFTRLI